MGQPLSYTGMHVIGNTSFKTNKVYDTGFSLASQNLIYIIFNHFQRQVRQGRAPWMGLQADPKAGQSSTRLALNPRRKLTQSLTFKRSQLEPCFRTPSDVESAVPKWSNTKDNSTSQPKTGAPDTYMWPRINSLINFGNSSSRELRIFLCLKPQECSYHILFSAHGRTMYNDALHKEVCEEGPNPDPNKVWSIWRRGIAIRKTTLHELEDISQPLTIAPKGKRKRKDEDARKKPF